MGGYGGSRLCQGAGIAQLVWRKLNSLVEKTNDMHKLKIVKHGKWELSHLLLANPAGNFMVWSEWMWGWLLRGLGCHNVHVCCTTFELKKGNQNERMILCSHLALVRDACFCCYQRGSKIGHISSSGGATFGLGEEILVKQPMMRNFDIENTTIVTLM